MGEGTGEETEELELELLRLRSNAINLTQCLQSLLNRIEDLEMEGRLRQEDAANESNVVVSRGKQNPNIQDGGQREATLRALSTGDDREEVSKIPI